MKKFLILSSLCLIAGSVSATPSFDPFADATGSGGTSYTVGANLIGQSNSTFFTAWYPRGTNFSASQPTIAADNLTYPNFQISGGNSVSIAPAASMNAALDLNVAATHTDTVYYSFLLKVTDLSAVSASSVNNPIAAFADDPNQTLAGNQIARLGSRLLTKLVGGGYVLGISRANSMSEAVYEPDAAAHSLNDVVLVVACYQRIAGVSTNVSLWVNPPPSSFATNLPPPPTAIAPVPATVNGALNNTGARVFTILHQATGAPIGIIDDVRVATNDWGYITGNPAISTPPTNRSVAQGNNVTFSAAGRGTGSLSYRWIKDGTTLLSNGGNISGANTASLTITGIGPSDYGTYAVYVTNGAGNFALSSSATLGLLTDPAITNQPQTFAGNFGTTAMFQVGASGTAPITYQWNKQGFGPLSDGGNISGSQSNVLVISNIAFPDSGEYYVTVGNNLGNVDSALASLIVADPYVTAQPLPVATNAGSAVQFQVAGAGSPSLSYQWLKNGNIIFNNPPYTGADTATLTIANVTSTEQANYSALVVGPFSNAVSATASLTVLTPASVLIPPRARTVKAGVKTAFVVGAGGSSPFTYQWQRNGVDISGATNSAYVVADAQAPLAGDYRVVIANAFSSVTSVVAALTVSNNLSLAQSNLVLVRIGDGANGLTINGSAMFLDQYTADGTYVNTITIPDSGPDAMAAVGWDNINGVNNGSTTGTSVTRSRDGRFMVLAGYNTNLNYGASLMASSATIVPKSIALVDSFGAFSMPVRSTNTVFDNSFWRAGFTDGANNYWGSASIAGTYYYGFDSGPLIVQNTFINARSAGLFNGDIYLAEASNPTGVLKISGMPTNAVTPTLLFSGSSGTYDIAVNPAGDLIYVTDQRNVANSGGIQRWEFNGSNWNLAYTLNTGFGNLGPRYIAADFSGANPVLYVTSNDQTFDNNRLIRVIDTGAGSAGTPLAFAGANQTFRGLQFGPVPNTVVAQPSLAFNVMGNNLVLNWSGSFTLMSSTNVAGPYVDVSGATSPYTNNMTGPQRFFGLRQ